MDEELKNMIRNSAPAFKKLKEAYEDAGWEQRVTISTADANTIIQFFLEVVSKA